ncbi:hypothetical protein [Metabacillus endolithicus]|uniref:Uncharacterized protein n=1 Tax=Metabacillus endolithicus TaxID=1535204 RepID=A0ABW5BW36_9BACI|nr:hypothetical protein [Metabacillus endolithicus]UPG64478.1 hypothetical protein MVE64_05130 [Metabacillus endolithicus]
MFAFFIAVASVVVSFLFYRGLRSKKEKILSIGSLTQSLSLLVAFILPIFYLMDISDIEALAHGISMTVNLVIYGTVINIFCKVIARFQA